MTILQGNVSRTLNGGVFVRIYFYTHGVYMTIFTGRVTANT